MRRRAILTQAPARVSLICGVALLCGVAPGCQPGDGSRSPEGESAADPSIVSLAADLDRWEGFGFSGSVLVARGEKVRLSRGYGDADRSKGAATTPQTLFDIGSLGKQFTAAAILTLAEEGRLAIEDSISVVIPGVPPDKAALTVHHLLTHTSGISDFGSEAERVSRDELVGQILQAPLAQPPGEAYEYSNLGYTLLAAIVELVSGLHHHTTMAAPQRPARRPA